MAYAKRRSITMRASSSTAAHSRRKPRGTCVLEGCGNPSILGSFCVPCQQWWSRVRQMTSNHFLEYLARCGRITVRKEFLGTTPIPPKQATSQVVARAIARKEQ